MRTIQIKSKGQTDIVEITNKVQKIVDEERLIRGSVHLFVIGSTASITTIEDDPNLYQDFKEALEKIFPYRKNWKHHRTWGDDNGAAHIRASIMGPSLLVPIINGKLFLGTWQKIVLINFDTKPRTREIIINCFSSKSGLI